MNLLKKAFEHKKSLKITYYSPHNNEHTTRVIDVYKIWKSAITAFCHLRNEERTFVIARISSVTLLKTRYKIPRGWQPQSIILDK
ncbi:WYL domain-containing protein [Candidatus Woesearchaeota archaeon]|nr:WYL domain-containing protein [Candidatus Woesearchaeota archaeon]